MDRSESSPEGAEAYSPSASEAAVKRAIDLTPIHELLERIERQYHPVQIWLFGSRARGQERPGSDWDLLVLVPDDTDDDALDPKIAWRLKRDVGIRADVLPCRMTEFQDCRNIANTLCYEVAHTGTRIDARS